MSKPKDNDEPSGASGGYPFSYHLLMTCTIAGRAYEFSKEFRSPTQHHVGDMIHVGGLEAVRVETIEWYINDPGHGFMELEGLKLGGVPSDWEWMLKYFDHSTPDLLG